LTEVSLFVVKVLLGRGYNEDKSQVRFVGEVVTMIFLKNDSFARVGTKLRCFPGEERAKPEESCTGGRGRGEG